ncbi:ferredoxin [bacterium]|nr:ferredoxin [bacterium]
MAFKINKKKCAGCQICVTVCPEGIKMDKDGKANIIDSETIKKCGGKNICPQGAIEECK